MASGGQFLPLLDDDDMTQQQPDNRDKIKELALSMREMPQANLPTTHHFADGMYCRSLFRSSGTLIVGKVHKKEHFYIVCFGCVDVTSGGEVKRYKSGDIIVSKPGTQRAVLAVEDSLCITVHRTNNTDLDEIERELIEPCDYALFDASNNHKAIEVKE